MGKYTVSPPIMDFHNRKHGKSLFPITDISYTGSPYNGHFVRYKKPFPIPDPPITGILSVIENMYTNLASIKSSKIFLLLIKQAYNRPCFL